MATLSAAESGVAADFNLAAKQILGFNLAAKQMVDFDFVAKQMAEVLSQNLMIMHWRLSR